MSSSTNLNVQLCWTGVTLRPSVYGDDGLQIIYNISDEKSYKGIVKSLNNFLAGMSLLLFL